MKLETNLDVIKLAGKEKSDENFEFRSFLKGQDEDEVDEIVHQLHDEIAAQIDCTKCGNCCSIFTTVVTDEEIDRLSAIDKMPAKDFKKKFIEVSGDNNKYLKDTPCRYLENKRCTIYADRPEECRSYPHTQKDEFNSRLFGVIDNYEVCPIVFNLYEQLKRKMKFRY